MKEGGKTLQEMDNRIMKKERRKNEQFPTGWQSHTHSLFVLAIKIINIPYTEHSVYPLQIP